MLLVKGEFHMNKKMAGVLAGLVVAGAATAGLVGTANASAPETNDAAAIKVSPNPAKSGQEVTITGHCKDGGEVASIGNLNDHKYPFDQGVKLVNDDPTGFEAKARVADGLGYGAGPVILECTNSWASTELRTQPAG